jgi:hypothetical protein
VLEGIGLDRADPRHQRGLGAEIQQEGGDAQTLRRQRLTAVMLSGRGRFAARSTWSRLPPRRRACGVRTPPGAALSVTQGSPLGDSLCAGRGPPLSL